MNAAVEHMESCVAMQSEQNIWRGEVVINTLAFDIGYCYTVSMLIKAKRV